MKARIIINLSTFLFLVLTSIESFSNDYKVNPTYGFDVWNSKYQKFDSLNSTLEITCCRSATISFSPKKALNASKYSLYSEEDKFIKYSWNDYQFSLPIESGNYIIKDGDQIILKLILTYIDPTTLIDIVLVDSDNIELPDLSSYTLNNTAFKPAYKNLKTNKIAIWDTCNAYINWTFNGQRMWDLDTVKFKNGDILNLFLDGGDICTEGCYSWLEKTFLINESITSIKNQNTTSIKMYPSPVSDQTTVILPTTDNYTIIITDLNGNQLQQFYNVNGYEVKINSKNMKQGVYFMNLINTSTNQIINEKFIVVR